MIDESRILELEIALHEIKRMILEESIHRDQMRSEDLQMLGGAITAFRGLIDPIAPKRSVHTPQQKPTHKTKVATHSKYSPPIKRDKDTPEYVYLIRTEDYGQVKIGKANNPKQRLKELQTGCFKTLHIHSTIQSKNALLLERKLHNKFRSYRLTGEWFKGFEVLSTMEMLLQANPQLDHHDFPNF
jgi:hypothetical protein